MQTLHLRKILKHTDTQSSSLSPAPAATVHLSPSGTTCTAGIHQRSGLHRAVQLGQGCCRVRYDVCDEVLGLADAVNEADTRAAPERSNFRVGFRAAAIHLRLHAFPLLRLPQDAQARVRLCSSCSPADKQTNRAPQNLWHHAPSIERRRHPAQCLLGQAAH